MTAPWPIGAVLAALALWCAVAGYLYPFDEPLSAARWLAPGAVLAGVALLAVARRQLAGLVARWQPGPAPQAESKAAPTPTAEPPAAEAPAAPSDAAPDVTLPRPDRALPPVRLGPRADPAFARWQLRWTVPGGPEGFVVLPSGARVLLGRSPDAHVVVEVEGVSREHLLFEVSSRGVSVMDLESSNGTWVTTGAGAAARLEARVPLVVRAKERIQLAEPSAVELTLEPMPKSGV